MIFLDLFLTFSKIGIVNFGGGYAMLSLIQSEVVTKHAWLTTQEFTDIVAVSQMTPGPIGINAATYVGYTAVVEAGYSPFLGVVGSLVATLSVIWLPFLLMYFVSRLLLRYKEHPHLKGVFSVMRPAIVGLIAAAALGLMDVANFGSPSTSPGLFAQSLVLFALAFVLSYRYKKSPLVLIGLAALVGLGTGALGLWT
ncbi:MAG: chromate transporter [Porphyromonas sp.]|nr:chromate transporter [Porphyromonas sp.]